ncbi:hypothetical protein HOT75_gp148 [Gordonia phage Daredevil]|uniref:Uncharacterized protein n=1 Tax=Gordonia phage Daredevil TaxID=2283286 RepID=A0A345MJ03_9CAUD|nr:hypothetical protein HOT75_gp148 [Gordonia phage Daredevil]AXH70534.1 hypothetical protein SEA_DAREDEVIL_148 [Gordonia phage Daredevil]
MTDNEKILADVDGLIDLLDELVPPTTSHFAVEGARTALSVLRRYAEDERIMTRDRKAAQS